MDAGITYAELLAYICHSEVPVKRARAFSSALVGARNLLRCRQLWLRCLHKTGRDCAPAMACQDSSSLHSARTQVGPVRFAVKTSCSFFSRRQPLISVSRAMGSLGSENASKHTNM